MKNQALFLYNLKLKANDDIKSLASFNFRKVKNEKELEKILIKEEILHCEKFNLYGLQYSIINNTKNIELEKLLNYIHILPCEYLIFSINQDNTITFNYFNPIFSKAVKISIKLKIKEKSINYLLSEENKDFLITGIYDEKLLSTFISYNKLNLKNLETSESNLLEINKISELKNNNVEKTNNKIESGLPIIITQEDFLEELYDLLILIPKKEIEVILYNAYMIHIDSNNNKQEIDEIKDDFDKDKENYSSGINKFIGNNIRIKNIELIFIFDKETQNKLILRKTDINNLGSNYCILNRIKFYCFSLETFKLYKTFDNINYYIINEFGDFDKCIKKPWKSYASERFSFLIEDEIKFINSKINGDIRDVENIFYRNNVKVPEKIEKEKIYILMNEIDKYYIIKGEVYNYINDNFILINKKDIDNEEIFELIILNTDEIYSNIKKEK